MPPTPCNCGISPAWLASRCGTSTVEGTAPVRDIRPGPEGSEPFELAVHGQAVYYNADDGRTGRELWRSDGTLDITEVLGRAAANGLISVLCEGGSAVATSLLDDGLVDRVAFFVAPRVYGAGGVPALGEFGDRWWRSGRALSGGRWTTVGGDCLFEADVKDEEPEPGEER